MVCATEYYGRQCAIFVRSLLAVSQENNGFGGVILYQPVLAIQEPVQAVWEPVLAELKKVHFWTNSV